MSARSAHLPAAGYRVVTLDSRGHGASKRGTLPMTPQQLAADALDALEGMGVAKAVPVGFSDGGNLALLMGAMRPDVVEALVAAGPNLVPGRCKALSPAALRSGLSPLPSAGQMVAKGGPSGRRAGPDGGPAAALV